MGASEISTTSWQSNVCIRHQGDEDEMGAAEIATLSFAYRVSVSDCDGRWAAYIEPPGTTVYCDTKAEVRARVRDAVNFFIESVINESGVEGLRRYLDAHGVRHSPDFLTLI